MAVQRRSEQSRQAILRAAFEICQEHGYAALTIEGVAARAGVGKQTIYRWWPSKGAVVFDAFLDEVGPALAVPADTGQLAGLRQFLHRTAGLLSHPRYGTMMSDLVGAVQHDAVLAKEFHERVYTPVRSQTIARIRQAQKTGEIRDADPEIVADLLFGPLWFVALVARRAPTPDYADSVVETVLDGLRP